VALGGMALALYLLGSVAAIGWMRHQGFKLPYTVIVAPWGWAKLPQVQAEHFLALGRADYLAGRMGEAAMELSVAHGLDKRGVEAGLLLAKIWEVARPEFADRIFSDLVARARQADEQADYRYLWYRSALARADFEAALGVASQAVLQPEERPGHAAIWVDAVLFNTRQTRRMGVLETLCSEPERLPEIARRAMSQELRVLRVNADVRPSVLAAISPPTAETFARKNWMQNLLRNGYAESVLGYLEGDSEVGMTPTERDLLRLDAMGRLGWQAARAVVLRGLMPETVRPEVLDGVVANLIRYPNATVNAEFWAWWEQASARAEAGQAVQRVDVLALMVVAGAAKETERLAEFTRAAVELGQGDANFLRAVGDFFLGKSTLPGVAKLMPGLRALGLETTYALLESYPEARAEKAPRATKPVDDTGAGAPGTSTYRYHPEQRKLRGETP
jgi:hypothetical protein